MNIKAKALIKAAIKLLSEENIEKIEAAYDRKRFDPDENENFQKGLRPKSKNKLSMADTNDIKVGDRILIRPPGDTTPPNSAIPITVTKIVNKKKLLYKNIIGVCDDGVEEVVPSDCTNILCRATKKKSLDLLSRLDLDWYDYSTGAYFDRYEGKPLVTRKSWPWK